MENLIKKLSYKKIALIIVLIAIIASCIIHWEDFVNGLMGKPFK